VPHDALQSYRLVILFFGVGLAISTLEYLFLLREFSGGGVYSWTILRTAVMRRGHTRLLAPLLDLLYGVRGVAVLLVLRLAGTISVMVLPVGSVPFTAAAAIMTVSHLLFSARQVFGDDGSDQMNSILALTILLCAGPHSTPLILNAGLWFIAMQAVLSYFSAGVAKAISPIWRGGAAVQQIFDTASYGDRGVAVFLARHQFVGALMSWGVIAFEVTFPAGLLLPAPALEVVLVFGAMFHLLNAVIMGLNSFLWSFLATYPALVYAAAQIRA
jgi:Vitamin K-dependent gamma-carboxylase